MTDKLKDVVRDGGKVSLVPEKVVEDQAFSKENLKLGDVVGDFKVTVCEERGPNKRHVWMERI